VINKFVEAKMGAGEGQNPDIIGQNPDTKQQIIKNQTLSRNTNGSKNWKYAQQNWKTACSLPTLRYI
jgi:hypothetical protein